MLDMLLGAAAAVSLQNPQNPLNIPVPTPEELARCFPRGVTAATPLSAISPAQLRSMVACANGLVAANINSITPARVDPLTTLVSAEASGTTLQYNSRVDLEANAVSAEQRQAIEQSTRAYVCTQGDMVRTIGFGGAYRYVWNDRNGRLVHQVMIDRCP